MHLYRPRKGLTFREVKKAPLAHSKLMEEGLDLSRSYQSKGVSQNKFPGEVYSVGINIENEAG